jgi:hypothetical protein
VRSLSIRRKQRGLKLRSKDAICTFIMGSRTSLLRNDDFCNTFKCVHQEPLAHYASGRNEVARTRTSTNPGITEGKKTIVWRCGWRLGGQGAEDLGLIWALRGD